MENIAIQEKQTINSGWQFTVRVGDDHDFTKHTITVERDYWQQLVPPKNYPEQLIIRSFKFLLAREPKESILPSFNLRQIQHYFPEYETEMKGGDLK